MSFYCEADVIKCLLKNDINNETKDGFRPQFYTVSSLTDGQYTRTRYALVSGSNKSLTETDGRKAGRIEGVNLVLLPRNSENIFRV